MPRQVRIRDRSATHLEYRQAKGKKPLHVFVRNRLEADYHIWKRNGRTESVQLSWIQSPQDYGLFALMDEHLVLSSTATATNWYRPFENSTDLEAYLQKRFTRVILPQKLAEAIHNNMFPLFGVDCSGQLEDIGQNTKILLHVKLKNVCGAPAFNCRMSWPNTTQAACSRDVVAPGEAVSITVVIDAGVEYVQDLVVEYDSLLGVSTESVFAPRGRVIVGPPLGLETAAGLKSRRFLQGLMPALEINGLTD